MAQRQQARNAPVQGQACQPPANRQRSRIVQENSEAAAAFGRQAKAAEERTRQALPFMRSQNEGVARQRLKRRTGVRTVQEIVPVQQEAPYRSRRAKAQQKVRGNKPHAAGCLTMSGKYHQSGIATNGICSRREQRTVQYSSSRPFSSPRRTVSEQPA